MCDQSQNCLLREGIIRSREEIPPMYLDFAKCQCEHFTPIRPTRIAPPRSSQDWSDEDTGSVVVACSDCKRVFEADELESKHSILGLSPYNPDAPLHAFPVRLPCEHAGCESRLVVIAVRRRDTTPEDLQAEMSAWTWEGLTCPTGHWLSDRARHTD